MYLSVTFYVTLLASYLARWKGGMMGWMDTDSSTGRQLQQGRETGS